MGADDLIDRILDAVEELAGLFLDVVTAGLAALFGGGGD